MKSLLCLLFGGLLSHLSLAQPSPSDNVPEPATIGRVVLKLAPLTLLELQNTLEAGAEVRIRERFSLQGQLGYAPAWLIWKQSSQSINTYANRENWRGRLEARWYVAPSRRDPYAPNRGRFPMGQYMAVDLLYKQLNATNQTTIGRQCPNFDCAYFEQTQQSITRYILGLGVKFGAQYIIGYNQEEDRPHWVLDTYVGVSVRKGWTEHGPLGLQPGDRQFIDRGSFLLIDPFEATNRLLPNLLLGVKIGYIL